MPRARLPEVLHEYVSADAEMQRVLLTCAVAAAPAFYTFGAKFLTPYCFQVESFNFVN